MFFLVLKNRNRKRIVLGRLNFFSGGASSTATSLECNSRKTYDFSHVKTHAEIVQAATERVKEENESKDRRRAISLDRRYALFPNRLIDYD